MKKLDQETIRHASHYGEEYAAKVSAILSLARVMSCENYGYEWKDYRRIVSQRSRALKAFRFAASVGAAHLDYDAKGRLTWSSDGTSCDYVVGQSSNEEITNLLRRLVNPESKWVS